ncbi:MAG: restriction endonuclease, partial [Actinomycetota bacterium]|nr:restriction endonuclease [Actinomycetota bacterium]
AAIRVITIRDADDKARLTAEADADLEALRSVADLVVAAHVATATQKSSALDARLLSAAEKVSAVLRTSGESVQRATAITQLRDAAAEWLNAQRPETAPVRSCLHWPLEFPEVFVDREQSGFDAMIGNPPFIGGKKISGAAGSNLREHLVRVVAGGVTGNADLVAYFFLRATHVAQSVGFLATNTIAQGDTSEVGLAQIVDEGWVIHRAISSTPWPGRAAVEIAKVWLTSVDWSGKRFIDGEAVPSIDETLWPGSRSGWRKQPLSSNLGMASQGSILLGQGFLLTADEAQQLIASEPASVDVVLPFISGEDLATSPTMETSTWAINFFDWPEDRAASFRGAWSHVAAHVKPDRMTKDRVKYPKMVDQWWRYWNERVDLYESIRDLLRVIALPRVSKYAVPVWIKPNQVINEKVIVVTRDDDDAFGVLSSGVHWRWMHRYTSTLGTGINYSPSDVLHHFVFPAASEAVASAAAELDRVRSEIMVAANEGVTKTYNRVHDPAETSDVIGRLRGCHVALDSAVCDAYGWNDLEMEHDFHPVRGQGVRFTFNPAVTQEILERLLELNKERYEAEVAAGLHAAPAKGAAKNSASKKSAAMKSSAPSLFGDDEDESDDMGDDE